MLNQRELDVMAAALSNILLLHLYCKYLRLSTEDYRGNTVQKHYHIFSCPKLYFMLDFFQFKGKNVDFILLFSLLW